MADISMCMGGGCGRKDLCYRYTAYANPYWQSYFSVVPVKADGSCDEYCENDIAEKLKKKSTLKLSN